MCRRRIFIRGGERLGDLCLGRAWLQRSVDRLKNAAIERHQVRHERNRAAEGLFDLGGVPM